MFINFEQNTHYNKIVNFFSTIVHSLTGIKTTFVCLHVHKCNHLSCQVLKYSIMCSNSRDFSFYPVLLPAHT